MNQLQHWIFRLGLLASLVFLLFPPWLYPADHGGSYHTGYAFIHHPPHQCLQGNVYSADENLMQIDSSLLAVEIGIAALLTLFAVSLCRRAGQQGEPLDMTRLFRF